MAQESANGYNSMSEDCLGLNIWTPAENNSRKAVMVFVYGGGKRRRCLKVFKQLRDLPGFERGSVNNPAYNGAHMAANEDVIVVAFKYHRILCQLRPDLID